MYRLRNNIFANINGERILVGCTAYDDNDKCHYLTNLEINDLRKELQIYDDGSRTLAYIEIINIQGRTIKNISKENPEKWIRQLEYLGYDISLLELSSDLDVDLPYHICDYSPCKKKIYIGTECVTDGIHMSYYCSHKCMCLDQNISKSVQMTRELLNEIQEFENDED